MDAEFWHERWRENRLGFHQSDYNALMIAHFERLNLPPGARVFVPLCGKTRDIAWLLSRGYRVSGVELSALAVNQLFADLEVVPALSDAGSLQGYAAPGLDIFAGDIFDLSREALGSTDAVYDRAALVALPQEMRVPYADRVHAITGGAQQFLLTFEYDQRVMEGPPFSVDAAELERIYADRYAITALAEAEVKGGLKGIAPATEHAWHLCPAESER